MILVLAKVTDWQTSKSESSLVKYREMQHFFFSPSNPPTSCVPPWPSASKNVAGHESFPTHNICSLKVNRKAAFAISSRKQIQWPSTSAGIAPGLTAATHRGPWLAQSAPGRHRYLAIPSESQVSASSPNAGCHQARDGQEGTFH